MLVLGARGLLGSEVVPALQALGHEVLAWGSAELDLREGEAVARRLPEAAPEAVVNLAAATAVDACEGDPAWAYAVNAVGPEHLARACAALGVPLLQVSTDYVFGRGEAPGPWAVEAPPDPVNVYGRSKLAGELAVRALCPRHFIVRTAWVYGAGGPNFVDTMRRLATEAPELKVVHDQRGNPTWTRPLAQALAALLGTEAHGTHHFSGSGEASWAELAEAVVAELGLKTPVLRVGSRAFPRPAPRAADTRLAPGPWPAGVPALPPWREALAAYLHGG